MMLWNCSSSVPWLTIRKDATAVPLGRLQRLTSYAAAAIGDGPACFAERNWMSSAKTSSTHRGVPS
jgi:hypothetical protein